MISESFRRTRGRPVTKIGWPSLYAAMKDAGYDDERLAEAIGVRKRAVGYWRRGTHVPWDGAIPKIAEILGCSPDVLRRDAPIKKGRNKYCNTVQNTVKQV